MNIIDMYVVVFSRIACWRLLMSEPMSRFISSASCCNTTLAQSISKTPSKERADETWWDQGHQSEHYFERCKQTFHTLLSRNIERAHQQCEMRKRWTQVFFCSPIADGRVTSFHPKGLFYSPYHKKSCTLPAPSRFEALLDTSRALWSNSSDTCWTVGVCGSTRWMAAPVLTLAALEDLWERLCMLILQRLSHLQPWSLQRLSRRTVGWQA